MEKTRFRNEHGGALSAAHPVGAGDPPMSLGLGGTSSSMLVGLMSKLRTMTRNTWCHWNHKLMCHMRLQKELYGPGHPLENRLLSTGKSSWCKTTDYGGSQQEVVFLSPIKAW